VLAAGAIISGVAGVIVVGAALAVRYLLRGREKLCDAMTVGITAGGLIVAGAVLSQDPWRSVDGYIGHSAGVQLLALVSVATLAASSVSITGNPRRPADVVGSSRVVQAGSL
jgi:arabinofuranan 3-O-arabinosyltransferase